MAKMYPQEYPDCLEHDSHAERRLFRALKTGLPSRMRVFFGVRWLAHPNRHTARDGEADFIIMDPKRGLMVVEVKGGSISRDPLTGYFGSNGKKISNPFEQSETSKRALLEKLGDCGAWPAWELPFVGHAVAFPDIPISQDMGPDAPSSLIMDIDGMRYAESWLGSAFDYWLDQQNGNMPRALDGQDVTRITDVLSPRREISMPLASRLDEHTEELATLTERQYWMLGTLQYSRRAVVRGFAGTGKTMLAREHARRLAAQGMNVLLLCFNRALARALRDGEPAPETLGQEHAKQGEVLAMTFHQLCKAAAQDAGIDPSKPASMSEQRYWNSYLARLLGRARNNVNRRFDAILVDEAQDFYQGWWLPLLRWQTDPERGVLCLFCDEYQNLYRDTISLPPDLIPYMLTQNCRNTLPVHKLAKRVYRGDLEPESLMQHGEPIQILPYQTRDDAHEQLRKLLHHLHTKEHIATEDIVVLAHHRNRGIVSELPALGNYQLVSKPPQNECEIFTTTIHAFKGLERKVVILADVTEAIIQGDQVPNLFYVAVTRASSLLVILCNKAAEPMVKAMLPSCS